MAKAGTPPWRGREKSITKAILAKRIAERFDFSQRKSAQTIQSILDAIVEAMAESAKEAERKGNDRGRINVEFRGFGSFKVRRRRPRIAKNPRTAKDVSVPAKWIPYFKVSREFRELIAKSK